MVKLLKDIPAEARKEKWRVMEDRKARDAIFEFCQEETKTYTEIKISNILNKIRVSTHADEYAIFKWVFWPENDFRDFTGEGGYETGNMFGYKTGIMCGY